MTKPAIRIVVFTVLLIAGSAAAVWLSFTLPTPAILALAAGAMAFAAGAALWRLWGKW